MTTTTATVRTRGHAAPARPRHHPQEVSPRRHLRPVPAAPPAAPPAARRRLRPRAALALAVAGLFVVLFAVALLQTVLVQGQIHLDGLRADLTERRTEEQLLREEVARLSAPETIRQVALDLGMVEPEATPWVPGVPLADPAR